MKLPSVWFSIDAGWLLVFTNEAEQNIETLLHDEMLRILLQ